MKKCLTILLNKVFKNDIELLYGEGSYVEVKNVRYCTNDHHYSIDCVLFIKDIKLFEESQLDGLRFIIEECWKYTGFDREKIMLITSFDII